MILLASMQSVYELMILLRPDFGGEEKPIKELVTKLVAGRTLSDFAIMGKKHLAFPIKKHNEAVYVVATVTGDSIKVVDLEKQMKLGTDIVRYLLTTKE